MRICIRHYAVWLQSFLCAVALVPAISTAQEAATDPDRPKVALVLSGGGAHAVAHLGVLVELERQRIPIDLIVGSGLGGLIGGLYSAGMTPQEIGELIRGTDWVDIFDPSSNREDLAFRRKEDDRSFLIKYTVGVKDGQAQRPTALVSTDKLGWLLAGATLDTKGIDDFDELPVAFRAVALDLLTGDEVDIGSGSLDAAMLATISSPGTFPPIQIDDRLLISGGLVNNMPVNIAKDWGADVVIAVELDVHQRSLEEVNSVFAVLEQVDNVLVKKSMAAGLALLDDDDILIRPDAEPVEERDFEGLVAAVRAGEAAAKNLEPQLARLSVGEAAYEQLVAAAVAKVQPDPVITAIELDNTSNVADGLILAQVSQPLNQPLDTARLEDDLRRVYAIGLFDNVDFSVDRQTEGATLRIATTEDIAKGKFWRFGVSLTDDLEGNSAYTASASFTWTQLNRLGAEWRTNVRIGEFQELSTDFYQPLDERGRWFVEPAIGYFQRNVNTYTDGEIDAQFRVEDLTASLSVGRVFGTAAEARAGLSRGSGESHVNIGPDLPKQEFETGAWLAGFRWDTIDNPFWPRSGTRANLSWVAEREALGADADLDFAFAGVTHVRSWGRRSLLGGIRVQAQVNTAPGVQNLLAIGGLFNLSGFQRDELTGRYTGVARLIYYERFGNNLLRGLLDTPLFVGGSVELGNAWQDNSDISVSNSLFAGSLFVGLDTIIGPVYFAGGLAEGGNSALYLFIGQPL